MATRLYFRYDRSYFPVSGQGWNAVSTANGLNKNYARGLDTVKADLNNGFIDETYVLSVTPSDLLWQEFYSKPLTAQSISGTIRG